LEVRFFLPHFLPQQALKTGIFGSDCRCAAKQPAIESILPPHWESVAHQPFAALRTKTTMIQWPQTYKLRNPRIHWCSEQL